MKKLMFALSAVLFIACSNSNNEQQDQIAESTTPFNETAYLQKGDSITSIAQGILMKNVAEAIAQKGVAGAVEFCNLKAIPLTDSISKTTLSSIHRFSDKNRNPSNAITTTLDKNAWTTLASRLKDSTINEKHFIVQEGKDVYYYKPIKIAMPTCLKCHGEPNKDIAPETLQTIVKKYPQDKATNYKEGDLRGMWRVKMNEL